MKIAIKDKTPENIRQEYEAFLLDKSKSGLQSSPANYKNAYNREELKQDLMNVCCVSCLYEITDVTALEKVKTELIHLRNKCKDDKTKAKRYKDCSSYVNKYMLFIENCDFGKEEAPSYSGCVYIITNRAFKKYYIKIGCTSKSAEERIKELYDTSVPEPFDIFATLVTPQYLLAENMMHKVFSDNRISESREFFYLLPSEALDQLTAIAKVLHGEINIYGKDGRVSKTINYKK